MWDTMSVNRPEQKIGLSLKSQTVTFLFFIAGDSSVGRAVDCSSTGRVFNSHSPETS